MYIFGGSSYGGYTPSYHSAHEFTVKVPDTAELKPDKWLLALCEIRIQREPDTEGYFSVAVTGVHPQSFYGKMEPVVRTFSLEKRDNDGGEVVDHLIFTDKYYVPIHTQRVSWMQVNLKRVDGCSERDLIKTSCVFHLKHK